MFRSFLPILLFLLLGSASAGVLFVRNADGTFTEIVDNGSGTLRRSDEPENCACTETLPADFAPASSLDVRSQSSHTDKTEENCTCIESLPSDFMRGTKKTNRAGKLRYSDLPLVEKSLKKDIFMLIAKNENYMAFLNHPSHKDLYAMINDMIRGPNQSVLREQVWKKIQAIEAYYKKFVERLNRWDTIEKALKLLMRLDGGSVHGKLTVEDTVELDQNLETIAFLLDRNLTHRLVTILKNDLHPVSSEHVVKTASNVNNYRKSSDNVLDRPRNFPFGNEVKKFFSGGSEVNADPSTVPPSLGKKKSLAEIDDPTIYIGPRRSMPFTNTHGTDVDESEVKSSEHHVEKTALSKDLKSSDDVLDRPRNFPFSDETKRFASGNLGENTAGIDDPTIYIGPRRPMPLTNSHGAKVEDEVKTFLNGDSKIGTAPSISKHAFVANSELDDPTIYIGPRRPMPFANNDSKVSRDLKSSDDVLDRPRNFPFGNDVNKFLSGDSEVNSGPSSVTPSLGKKENMAEIDDPTIYIGPRRPMPFTNNHGTDVDVSEVKSSEHHVVRTALNVNNDLKSSDDVLDRPRNFPLSDEKKKFASGNLGGNTAGIDDPTIYIGPRRPMPLTNSHGTRVENEVKKFLNGDTKIGSAPSIEHPAVGNSELDDPTIYTGPRRPMPFANHHGTKVEDEVKSSQHHTEKTALNVNKDLKSSDDVLDRPRNFPFGDEVNKFLSGDSDVNSDPSSVTPSLGKKENMAQVDDPTIYIGPRRPMPFTNSRGGKVEDEVKPSEHLVEKTALNDNKDLKSSDDVLDRPRNFPFSDERMKFVSGNSGGDNVSTTVLPDNVTPSVVPARKNAATTVTTQASTLKETAMAKGKHSGQETTKSDKNYLHESTTMITIPKRMRGNRSS